VNIDVTNVNDSPAANRLPSLGKPALGDINANKKMQMSHSRLLVRKDCNEPNRCAKLSLKQHPHLPPTVSEVTVLSLLISGALGI
jgi:hypothetical protein